MSSAVLIAWIHIGEFSRLHHWNRIKILRNLILTCLRRKYLCQKIHYHKGETSTKVDENMLLWMKLLTATFSC